MLFWRHCQKGAIAAPVSPISALVLHLLSTSPCLPWRPLQFLVALQAALTVVGNFTCWLAAYQIYAAAQQEQGA